MAKDSLSIKDNRTGLTYELPFVHGCVRAMDLRQIKTGPDDFGVMTYDPAYTNTASCRSTITYIDGERGILLYRGYPIEQLAESIAQRTLLQSLNVRAVLDADGNETGMFEVPAGGRRYRALELLVKQKRMAKTQLVPCVVREGGVAEDDSIAENDERVGLHPLDQFRAFQTLRDLGMSEEDIAARHFVTAAIVKQRLRLASVSPKLHEVYAEDGMTLEQLMAFSVTGDHALLLDDYLGYMVFREVRALQTVPATLLAVTAPILIFWSASGGQFSEVFGAATRNVAMTSGLLALCTAVASVFWWAYELLAQRDVGVNWIAVASLVVMAVAVLAEFLKRRRSRP